MFQSQNQSNHDGQSGERAKISLIANEHKVKTTKPPKARENAGDQVAIGFSFTSDWLTEWREFSGPITERSKTKQMFSRISFDIILKY